MAMPMTSTTTIYMTTRVTVAMPVALIPTHDHNEQTWPRQRPCPRQRPRHDHERDEHDGKRKTLNNEQRTANNQQQPMNGDDGGGTMMREKAMTDDGRRTTRNERRTMEREREFELLSSWKFESRFFVARSTRIWKGTVIDQSASLKPYLRIHLRLKAWFKNKTGRPKLDTRM